MVVGGLLVVTGTRSLTSSAEDSEQQTVPFWQARSNSTLLHTDDMACGTHTPTPEHAAGSDDAG